jgi:hypothetical protein
MDEIGIAITLGFEDESMLCLNFKANNGRFQGQLPEWYCYPSEIEKIGTALSSFPSGVLDEYLWEVGSAKPEDRHLYYFAIRAYTFDKAGHCALELTMKLNQDKPAEAECHFSIVAEPWAIHRLGELFKKFSTLKYSSLKWSLNPDNDLLGENAKAV